ncbi:MAG: Ig-like domain-containing protein [Pseudomonadota bacterium]
MSPPVSLTDPQGYPVSDVTGSFMLGTGSYQEVFEAENLASAWDFIYIPVPKLPKGIERFLGGPAGRKAAQTVFEVGVEAGLIAADFNDFLFPSFRTGSVRQELRELAVLDLFPPDVTVTQNTFEIEALELGGASVFGPSLGGGTNQTLLATGFTVTDDCTPFVDLKLSGPTPAFWPLGETTRVVWTAQDQGPNEDREPNSVEIEQFVTVVDTLPPSILAPPARVVETSTATATIVLEAPRVFDFGDQDPIIRLAGLPPPPSVTLPLGITELPWSATDDFGNSGSATQRINVKLEGTNQTPQGVAGPPVPAQTFTPTEILLRGTDPDDDPLSFRIVDFPPDGGFEAPLLPYFIEDFRGDFEAQSSCDPGRPFDELADPTQVKITDEGLTYILDCEGTAPQTQTSRISVLDAERNLLAGRSLPRNGSFSNGIYLSPLSGEILYGGQTNSGATPNPPRFFRLDAETLDTLQEYRAASINQLVSFNAFIIDGNDLLYVAEGQGVIRVFDLQSATDQGGFLELADAFFQFDLDPNETAGGGFQAVRDIALTHRGELLFATGGRIHRMTASARLADGSPQVGEVTGWLGACGSGEGCDLSRNASRGYSCETGVTCNTGQAVLFGSGPGQFDGSVSLGVDRRDSLYVADFLNFRVQRFTDNGVYGGEAVSDCPGDQRCFLLGDFGQPKVISVNSRNLFVLDESTSVVHTFETSVIEPVDDSTARVVYTANDGFQGTDTFSFAVTDGLDSSALTLVNVAVERAFRRPVADALFLNGLEDTALPIVLSATDPDGALDLPLSYELLNLPDQGTLTGEPPQMTYQPPADWYGTTSFEFRAFDGLEYSEPETAIITIAAVNDAPFLEFVGVDTDDPDTAEIEMTVGFPSNFRFRFSDVDDVDLHRFDVEWTVGSGGGDIETDVVFPTALDASPLLISPAQTLDSSGDVVATFTYDEPVAEDRLVACLSDNVVLDNGVKNNSQTTLRNCTSVTLQNLPRPELDVVIEAPQVIPAQYDQAQVLARITNRRPTVGSGVSAPAVNFQVTLPFAASNVTIERVNEDGVVPNRPDPVCTPGAVLSCQAVELMPNESFIVRLDVPTTDLAAGSEISIVLDAQAPGGEVTAPSGTQATMTIGAPADIVVTTTEGANSDCQFQCSRLASNCPPAEAIPACTLSDALDLVQFAAPEAGNPIIQLGQGTYRIDEESAPYQLESPIFLLGLGPERTFLSGNGEFPLINTTSIAVTIQDLALISGDGVGAPSGAVVNVESGAGLSLRNVLISNSEADSVIRNTGDLMLERVSMADNFANDYLIENARTARLSNVMLLDNRIDRQFFGALVGNTSGTLELEHVTFAGNFGTALSSLPNTQTISIASSVLADSDQPGCRFDSVSNQSSSGGNVFPSSSGCPTVGDDLETDLPLLSGREVKAGLPLRAPLPESPVVDFVSDACLAMDLIGRARPVDGDGDGQAACDSGAIEILLDRAFRDRFEL